MHCYPSRPLCPSAGRHVDARGRPARPAHPQHLHTSVRLPQASRGESLSLCLPQAPRCVPLYESGCLVHPSFPLPLPRVLQAFVRRTRPPGAFDDVEAEDDDAPDYNDAEVTEPGGTPLPGGAAASAPAMSTTDEDLLGMGGLFSAPAPAPAPPARSSAPAPAAAAAGGGDDMDDLFGGAFGGPSSAPAPAPSHPSYPVLGEKEGLVVRGGLAWRNRATVFDLVIENSGGGACGEPEGCG